MEALSRLGIDRGLLLAQVVNFGLLMIILQRLLYKPVLNMLTQRRDRIAQSMKDVERASAAAREAEQEKAKLLEDARREAQEIRAQATRDTEKIAQEIRFRAEQEAGEIRTNAQAEAQRLVDNALADANKQIAELAILATEQLLGRELAQKSEQERFVSEFLAQHNGSAA